MGAGAILRGLTQAGTAARLGHVQGQQDAEAQRQAQLAKEAEEAERLQQQLRQEALLKFQLGAPEREAQRIAADREFRTQQDLTNHEQRLAEIAAQGRSQRENTVARVLNTPPKAPPRPRPPTEMQGKARFFHRRAQHATQTLNQFDNARMLDVVASKGGLLGNWAKSPEGRQLIQAGKQWAMAVLRQDSGGAITEEEMEEYFETYLPRPGDDETTLAQKREARRVVEEGLAELGQVSQATPENPWRQ